MGFLSALAGRFFQALFGGLNDFLARRRAEAALRDQGRAESLVRNLQIRREMDAIALNRPSTGDALGSLRERSLGRMRAGRAGAGGDGPVPDPS